MGCRRDRVTGRHVQLCPPVVWTSGNALQGFVLPSIHSAAGEQTSVVMTAVFNELGLVCEGAGKRVFMVMTVQALSVADKGKRGWVRGS